MLQKITPLLFTSYVTHKHLSRRSGKNTIENLIIIRNIYSLKLLYFKILSYFSFNISTLKAVTALLVKHMGTSVIFLLLAAEIEPRVQRKLKANIEIEF